MSGYTLKFIYSEDFDTLEMWIPAFEVESKEVEYEDGLYEYFFCSRLKGGSHAFNSLMIDAFSAAYPSIIIEVECKEPAVEQESYDVPELGLHHVKLSAVLEAIYTSLSERKNRQGIKQKF